MATRRSEQWVQAELDAQAAGAASSTKGGRPAGSLFARTLNTRAVDLLSRREYSRAELGRKLAQPTLLQREKQLKGGEPFTPPSLDEIEAVLDKMASLGYLDDARFAASLVHRKSQRMGTAKVMMTLAPHKLPSEDTAQIAAQLKNTELERCHATWSQRFSLAEPSNEQPFEEAQKHRAKQGRFLISRGFNSDAVRRVLSGWVPEPE